MWFVFLVVTDHSGKMREFYLADKERILWTEDRAKMLGLSEAEASDLATDLNAGCGSL